MGFLFLKNLKVFIKMKISSRQETTIDYPGKFGYVLFTPGCNFRCGYCHNPELKDFSEGKFDLGILLRDISAKAKSGWYTGVCISGGEPTLQQGLPDFARRLKESGVAVKIDTNGSNPEMLERLISEKNIDYIAMDVKSPKNLYASVVGRDDVDLGKIQESVRLISNSGIGYEFRTTVVPVNDGILRFMTADEISEIARWILETAGREDSKYFVQRFVARDKNEMMDGAFGRESLPDEMHETPMDLLEQMRAEAIKLLPNTFVR